MKKSSSENNEYNKDDTMNVALIEKAIDGAVEVAKFISGQISENKKQKTEAEREKDRIISDTFNRNLQQLEKAREENRNLNKEVKENLEKHKREESELIARIMEDQKNKFRDYVSMMKSSQEYQNKIFGLHMSWMNNVLNSSQSSMSKMGEVLSSAHDNADFSTQDKLDHIGEVREKIKKIKDKIEEEIIILNHDIKNLTNSIEKNSAIKDYINDKRGPDSKKDKLKITLMDIRALEEINEKEIELINKKKDKDIAEKQISVIDSQILYMREKNIEALNKMREGMFAAIKIHEHAIESKHMFEMNDQNHINEPAYEERDITILSHQNLIDNK